jgi:predicted AAA+ superfamily ATPase
MIFKIEEIIKQAQKEVKEVTGINLEIIVNEDKSKKSKIKNNYYFLCNDDLNIEIVISFAEINGIVTKDFIDCRIQKPKRQVEKFDFRSIHGGDKCKDYIVDNIKRIVQA